MPLKTRLQAVFNIESFTKVINAKQTASAAFEFNPSISFTDGEAADQAEIAVALVQVIGAGANVDLDLFGGLSDAFGDLVNFKAVKGLFFQGESANDAEISIGGHPTAAFASPFGDATDIVKVGPGDFLAWSRRSAGGWTVTDSTGDTLRLNNPGAIPNTLNIGIIGTV